MTALLQCAEEGRGVKLILHRLLQTAHFDLTVRGPVL